MQLPPRGGTWVGSTCYSQYAFSASNREELIQCSGGDTLPRMKRYKEANFDSRSSLVTNFNESTSQSSQYACSRSKREELIIEWCGGDTLARVK
ncbi:hypothetical protein V1477_012408 [Vespula maculifrons]|uniref:Uncharacterized protein n=1 Tax=Vespula maculifrons TaxID=7453 RepID=A0ABD2BXF2_VESMC